MKTSFTAVALLALAASAPASANLIINGDFEANPVGSAGFFSVKSGTAGITGWTVGGNSVDLIKGNYGAITGNSVDILGSPGPGSLSQSFATLLDYTYTLSFDLSRNSNVNSRGTGYLDVRLNDGPVTHYTGTYGTVSHYSQSFSGTGGLVSLLFSSANVALTNGAVLDNVSVAAVPLPVPEPESYTLMLAGLAALCGTARRRRAA